MTETEYSEKLRDERVAAIAAYLQHIAEIGAPPHVDSINCQMVIQWDDGVSMELASVLTVHSREPVEEKPKRRWWRFWK